MDKGIFGYVSAPHLLTLRYFVIFIVQKLQSLGIFHDSLQTLEITNGIIHSTRLA